MNVTHVLLDFCLPSRNSPETRKYFVNISWYLLNRKKSLFSRAFPKRTIFSYNTRRLITIRLIYKCNFVYSNSWNNNCRYIRIYFSFQSWTVRPTTYFTSENNFYDSECYSSSAFMRRVVSNLSTKRQEWGGGRS